MDHVVLPIFWAEKPALWFAQVEAVFALNKVASDSDMYDHIISELSNDVISLVEDIILNPPEIESSHRYQYLKGEVIKRIYIKQLENEKIGSMKPSEFLSHLRTKADWRVSEETVKEMWIEGLPSHIKEVIEKEDSDNLDLLVIIADKIHGINLVEKLSDRTSIEVEEKFNKLLEKMEKLYKEVIDIQATIKQKVEVCENCKIKTPKANLRNNQNVNQICWYHDNFGSRAVKCVSPCNYKEEQVTQNI